VEVEVSEEEEVSSEEEPQPQYEILQGAVGETHHMKVKHNPS